jgi:hypothetical protein
VKVKEGLTLFALLAALALVLALAADARPPAALGVARLADNELLDRSGADNRPQAGAVEVIPELDGPVERGRYELEGVERVEEDGRDSGGVVVGQPLRGDGRQRGKVRGGV